MVSLKNNIVPNVRRPLELLARGQHLYTSAIPVGGCGMTTPEHQRPMLQRPYCTGYTDNGIICTH